MKRAFSSIFNRPSFHSPVVDGIRAVSILMVVIGHWFHFHADKFTQVEKTSFFSPFSEIFRGDLGVDMFFVISGFLIGSILFKEYKKHSYISYKKFYVRRFFRLMPVYLVSMLMMWVVLVLSGGEGEVLEIDKMIANIWTNLLYVNNFINIEEQFMGWCWSLAVEEQFYFLIPIFIVVLLRCVKNKHLIFLYLLIISCIIRFYIVFQYNLVGDNYWGGGLEGNIEYWRKTFSLLYDNLYTRYGSLLIGVWGSYLLVYDKKSVLSFFSKSKLTNRLFLLSVFIICIVFFKIDFYYFGELSYLGIEIGGENLLLSEKIYFSIIVAIGRNVFSLTIMYLIFYCMFQKNGVNSFINKFLSSKFLFPISQLSYSTYLIHPIIMLTVFRYSTPLLFFYFDNCYFVFLVNGFLSFSIILIFSTFLYVFIEKPFMEIRKKIFIEEKNI
tara:strand:- start:55 stop:1374 length:1320 start_codon:yes stop_codon:yes gene_type:complete